VRRLSSQHNPFTVIIDVHTPQELPDVDPPLSKTFQVTQPDGSVTLWPTPQTNGERRLGRKVCQE
jgi:hypothetical protein